VINKKTYINKVVFNMNILKEMKYTS